MYNFIRPASVLEARKRRVCPICTVQEDRPVMIEEGSEWDLHQKSRAHRRLAGKLAHNGTYSYPPQSEERSSKPDAAFNATFAPFRSCGSFH